MTGRDAVGGLVVLDDDHADLLILRARQLHEERGRGCRARGPDRDVDRLREREPLGERAEAPGATRAASASMIAPWPPASVDSRPATALIRPDISSTRLTSSELASSSARVSG